MKKPRVSRRTKTMAKIINGKEISATIRAEIKEATERLVAESGVRPGLAVIIVGEDPASQVYVRNKKRACDEVGFYSESYELPESTTQDELNALVDKLNKNDKIHGILCQLPLPKHLDENEVIMRIDPKKDVDAFHPENVGKIMIGDYSFLPCTPAGVMALLERSGIDVCGKECVVVGRSNIVGKPQAMLLLHANGTVTICHSRTKNLAEVCRRADILVAAIGKADFFTGDMVKDGAVVIDVGMNRRADGKLTGDVDFASVEPKASYITPVPGGVGPMTITMLMQNTLTAAKNTL
jgi:methylenetetrahydrofolate dehydrogenase (NADP+)/methenyltetrahydrofolate cyclohydrolase